MKAMIPSRRELEYLIKGEHGDPFRLLGAHVFDGVLCVRAFLLEAKEAWVVQDAEGKLVFKMKKVHNAGVFEALIEGHPVDFRYRLRITTHSGETLEFYDPYAFSPSFITDFDIHLFAEGNHHKIYEKLGARVMEIDGVRGVYFAVWAPNAKRVSVVGDFNLWDGRRHPMRKINGSGIWELFIPMLDEGCIYKFEIKSLHGVYLEKKSDPYAFYAELRPKSASVVCGIDDKYIWNDIEWIEARKNRNWFESPVSIYEVHLGSWKRLSEADDGVYNYRQIADMLVPYVKGLGYTHIELLPVSEHPLDASWGYQPINYFAPTSRFGKPEDFMYFVDKCHENGIGVIIDWVPAHFPKDAHGLAFFDGTWLYEHSDPRKGEHRDWGTLVFNYGRNEVRNFLIANALFWFDKYHIDGLRVDAVSSMLYLDYSRENTEWIPNIYGGNENLEAIDFIKKFNEAVHHYYPGALTIAEESTSWPNVTMPTYLGGLGFSMKWNMGWMHDTLEYFSQDPIFRKFHTYDLTFSLVYAFSENFVLSISHDEVVYGKRSMLNKMPGDRWQQFANLRALYGYMYGHPGKKLLFMGSEFGQCNEWCFFRSLDWELIEDESHSKLLNFVKDLNMLYVSEPALYEVDFDHHGFEWIDFHDHDNSVISFIRRARDKKDFLVFVFNLTPEVRYGYRIGVPESGVYKEMLNSDSEFYGGSNVGNNGFVTTEYKETHGRAFSLNLTLPPLSISVFKPVRE